MRKIHIVGNWKMNQSLAEINAFVSGLEGLTGQDCEAWVAPQFIHIPYLKEKVKSIPFLKVGAQNCSAELSGAFTGDTSLTALKEIGTHFAIIGHSERRAIFGEGHELLNKKTHQCLELGMTAIFCVGESLEERESGITNKIIEEQIIEGLKGVPAAKTDKLIIAYEPVWAIGTGKTASPDQAQEVHAFIRNLLAEKLSYNAENIVILYGGSVKPGNVAQLLSQKDIDGGLVGGASLKASDFAALCTNR